MQFLVTNKREFPGIIVFFTKAIVSLEPISTRFLEDTLVMDMRYYIAHECNVTQLHISDIGNAVSKCGL